MTEPVPTSAEPSLPSLLESALPLTVIEQAIIDLVDARGAAKSICPSEVARALRPEAKGGTAAGTWQSLLTPVRQAAIRLAEAGRIEILRKGKPVPTAEVRGVIRLRAKGERA